MRSSPLRWAAWGAGVASEVVLAAGVALGSDAAAYAAAGLLAVFAAALVLAIRRGAAGEPCGCFAARSTVGWRAVVRNLGLSAALLVLPVLPQGTLSTDAWLAVGFCFLLVAVTGLTVAVLALAREVGVLRLRGAPQSALEVAHEGPALGQRTSFIDRFRLDGRKELALAVFSSPGCHLCRSLAPAVAAFGRHPIVSLRVFDEKDDADAWRALRVPGSPFAVALDRDGVVRAKGTFNSFGQLESVLAAAEQRVLDGARA
ncbi:MAG TPA: MauE/DoxX family redox-associated membrane protein, partial [Gaiellaceae bacterium]